MSPNHAQAYAIALSFLVLSVGCFMAWPPLGLIVPAALVLGGIVWTRVRGKREE